LRASAAVARFVPLGGRAGSVGGFLREFASYVRRRTELWLTPIFIAMLLFGGLIVFTEGTAVASFVDTLF
jgi:hypothetical protein